MFPPFQTNPFVCILVLLIHNPKHCSLGKKSTIFLQLLTKEKNHHGNTMKKTFLPSPFLCYAYIFETFWYISRVQSEGFGPCFAFVWWFSCESYTVLVGKTNSISVCDFELCFNVDLVKSSTQVYSVLSNSWTVVGENVQVSSLYSISRLNFIHSTSSLLRLICKLTMLKAFLLLPFFGASKLLEGGISIFWGMVDFPIHYVVPSFTFFFFFFSFSFFLCWVCMAI